MVALNMQFGFDILTDLIKFGIAKSKSLCSSEYFRGTCTTIFGIMDSYKLKKDTFSFATNTLNEMAINFL